MPSYCKRWGASLLVPVDPGTELDLPDGRVAALQIYDLWSDPDALTPINDQRPDLVERYVAFLEAQWAAHRALEIDAQVAFEDLRTPFLEELRRLMPFGHGNPNPLFAAEQVFLSRAPRIVGNNHLRLSISQKPFTRQAIGYHMGDLAESLSAQFPFHVAFSLDLDSRPAGKGSQLRLRDIRFPYTFETPHG